LAQVSLGQLLYLPGSKQSNPGRGTWWNKISRRSIDFVICDTATLRPLVAIELDEPSHTSPQRQTRDDEVDKMIAGSGLPFIRILTSRGYETRELEATILPHLKSGTMPR
jgi:very-short-patch-repair endonuclease